MPALPTGTVTFLLTDAEGATRLWEERREAMPAALVQHDAIAEFLAVQHRGAAADTARHARRRQSGPTGQPARA
jgi:hypothetical protein